MAEAKKRPGRKFGAEKRKLARAVLCEFATSEEFYELPGNVKAAIRCLCPEISKIEEMLSSKLYRYDYAKGRTLWTK